MAKKRYWEIDFLRGIAVVLMIIYHFLWSLDFFAGYINIISTSWTLLAVLIASTFIFLAGVSLHLSYSRSKAELSSKELTIKYLKRGLKVFSLGLVITVGTLFFLPKSPIIFGILHFIGTGIILSRPLLNLKKENLILGLLFILIGLLIQSRTYSFPWLLWLGFLPKGAFMIDYFPLLPWFGLLLMGMYFGKRFYPEFERGYQLPDLSNSPFIKPLALLGRNSLLVYFLHEPLILITLTFLF